MNWLEESGKEQRPLLRLTRPQQEIFRKIVRIFVFVRERGRSLKLSEMQTIV